MLKSFDIWTTPNELLHHTTAHVAKIIIFYFYCGVYENILKEFKIWVFKLHCEFRLKELVA